MAGVCPVAVIPRAATAFAVIAMHLIRRRREGRRKRRWWVRDIFRKRLQYGNRLMVDMSIEQVNDTIKNFTRMMPEVFDDLVNVIEPKVGKMDTNMREAITVKERLAITLRFLATGDSYASLQYLFRVSISSISQIIPEVCAAIIEALDEYVKVCVLYVTYSLFIKILLLH